MGVVYLLGGSCLMLRCCWRRRFCSFYCCVVSLMVSLLICVCFWFYSLLFFFFFEVKIFCVFRGLWLFYELCFDVGFVLVRFFNFVVYKCFFV